MTQQYVHYPLRFMTALPVRNCKFAAEFVYILSRGRGKECDGVFLNPRYAASLRFLQDKEARMQSKQRCTYSDTDEEDKQVSLYLTYKTTTYLQHCDQQDNVHKEVTHDDFCYFSGQSCRNRIYHSVLISRPPTSQYVHLVYILFYLFILFVLFSFTLD